MNVTITPSESASGNVSDVHVIKGVPTANEFWDCHYGKAVIEDDLEKDNYPDHGATVDHMLRTVCIIVHHVCSRFWRSDA